MMHLSFEDGSEAEIADCEALSAALVKLENAPDGFFVILARGDEDYMQTALAGPGWVIEQRSGSEATHVQARRPVALAPPPERRRGWLSHWLTPSRPSGAFTAGEVAAALEAYRSGSPVPAFIEWVPL